MFLLSRKPVSSSSGLKTVKAILTFIYSVKGNSLKSENMTMELKRFKRKTNSMKTQLCSLTRVLLIRYTFTALNLPMEATLEVSGKINSTSTSRECDFSMNNLCLLNIVQVSPIFVKQIPQNSVIRNRSISSTTDSFQKSSIFCKTLDPKKIKKNKRVIFRLLQGCSSMNHIHLTILILMETPAAPQ